MSDKPGPFQHFFGFLMMLLLTAILFMVISVISPPPTTKTKMRGVELPPETSKLTYKRISDKVDSCSLHCHRDIAISLRVHKERCTLNPKNIKEDQ